MPQTNALFAAQITIGLRSLNRFMVISFFEKHGKLSWMITIIGAVLIFYMSSLTFPSTSTSGNLSVVYHFSAFFLFSIFLLISTTHGKYHKLIIFMSILIAVFYGVLDEVHQLYVLGRTCTLEDMLTDSIGVFVSLMVYSVRIKLKDS